MADPVSVKDYNEWSQSYQISQDDGDGVPSKGDIFVDRNSGSEVAFENVQADICSYYSKRGHQLSDIEQCRSQSGNARAIQMASEDVPQDIDVFGQLQAGLVRFIGSKGSPTVWMNRADGTIEIEYSSSTTATALICQLKSFGLKDIDKDRIQQIAGRNGNATFEGTELEELDQYLEQVTSRDKAIVMQAVSINGNALQYASGALKKDRQVVMAALQSNKGPAFCFADDSLKQDRAFVLEAVKVSPSILEDVAEPLKKDREIVMAAVSQAGWCLKYADETLKKDREIVMAAIKQSGTALQYADASLRRDKEIVLTAVKNNGEALQYVDESLVADRQFMLECYKANYWSFQYAPIALRKDKAFILEAEKICPVAFKYADDSLKSDRDFVLQVVRQNGSSIMYADDSLRKDKEVALTAVTQRGAALEDVDESLKRDKDVVLAAVKQSGFALQYADESLKQDRDVAFAAVTQTGYALQYADESLRRDKEVVLAAVTNYGFALQWADATLRKDEQVVLAAVKRHALALEYADESLKKERSIVSAAVDRDGEAFKFADASLRSDRSFALNCIYYGPSAILHADKQLREDMSFVSEAIDWNIGCYKFLSPEVIEKLPKEQKERISILKGLGIEFPERFIGRPPYVLDTVIANRQGAKPKPSQPLAVIIYPKKDWNGAFKNNQIRELIDRGYYVLYFEAGSEDEVYSALQSATSTTGRKAQLLILGGHGDREHTSMGEGDPASTDIGNESAYIDLSDEREMIDQHLDSHLTDDSVVILESCSTGKGRGEEPNVANMMKRVFPQSRVFAPTAPTGVVQYSYDENNRVIGAEYVGGSPITYSIER